MRSRSHAQLALLGDDGASVDPYYSAVWDRLRGLLADVVAVVGVKQAAGDLDTSPSQLKHALAARDRHHMRMEWLPYLIDKAPSDDVVALLASIRGLVVEPEKTLTPAERLAQAEDRAAKHLSPEIRALIFGEVRR